MIGAKSRAVLGLEVQCSIDGLMRQRWRVVVSRLEFGSQGCLFGSLLVVLAQDFGVTWLQDMVEKLCGGVPLFRYRRYKCVCEIF